jgi:hypothetical protein
VLSFFHFLDDLPRERVEVARVARGDDAVVGDDFAVLPLAAGVDHVGLDRLVGGHLAAFREAGLTLRVLYFVED